MIKNKTKIINDPIYGFIVIESPLVLKIIDHPYFQRLRRISQTALTYLVYPGSTHTRFHHALGTMHLTQRAIEILRRKGVEITRSEEEATLIATLLHDVGHGPFSHTLEHSLLPVRHEDLSLLIMEKLNLEFEYELSLAIRIFRDQYTKRFLHHLVSSQLDMDRLDYLRRDSFYTGVHEGMVNSERLITMLNVHENELVVDAKGIYSVEKFLIARRLMYWQVYLHKTVLSAELLLQKIFERARWRFRQGYKIHSSRPLEALLRKDVNIDMLRNDPVWLAIFLSLDDTDIWSAIKLWYYDHDPILSGLCMRLIDRNLLKIKLTEKYITPDYVKKVRNLVKNSLPCVDGEEEYLVFSGKVENKAYDQNQTSIKLLTNSGESMPIEMHPDFLRIDALTESKERNFICYPEIKGALDSKDFTVF
ncbi:MAG: HD domain-containing protein [Thermaurantimonas sp.]